MPSSGLFLWTPLIILCVVGLFYFEKKNTTIGLPILILFLFELYAVASWSTWWQGASFSGRMFVSSLPVLAVGLGFLLSQKKIGRRMEILSLLLAVINPIVIIIFLKSF